VNYFTPELIVAYGTDDLEIWKEAEAKWEAACQQYNSALASLKPKFPPGLLFLEDRYSLHDAVVRGMGRRKETFVIVLQLDTPPQPLLTLIYDLVEEAIVQRDVLPPEYCSTGGHIDWQYDEIEKVDGEPPTWRHSILLSNGWELTLHFRNIQVEEMQALIPPPLESHALPTAVNMSQSV
jgi:hypothetical protein